MTVAVIIAVSSVSNVVTAGDVNWSTSTITPINDSAYLRLFLSDSDNY